MRPTAPTRLSIKGLQSPIAGPCTLNLLVGECIAIMGASGAGKSVLLRLIADNARRRLRATDILGRFGGDEFVVILPATSAAEAVEVMRELGDACLAAGGASLSIGVADLAEDCASVQVLLNRADAQLYRAKKAGRHRVMAAFIP